VTILSSGNKHKVPCHQGTENGLTFNDLLHNSAFFLEESHFISQCRFPLQIVYGCCRPHLQYRLTQYEEFHIFPRNVIFNLGWLTLIADPIAILPTRTACDIIFSYSINYDHYSGRGKLIRQLLTK
jgi:hypothetical protein